MTQVSEFQKIQEQIKVLQSQAEEARAKENGEAMKTIRELITLYGFKPREVFPPNKRGPRKGSTVAIKYRDPESGATWSGRGKAPKWMQGRDKDEFK